MIVLNPLKLQTKCMQKLTPADQLTLTWNSKKEILYHLSVSFSHSSIF
jgi:hypothetical protein